MSVPSAEALHAVIRRNAEQLLRYDEQEFADVAAGLIENPVHGLRAV